MIGVGREKKDGGNVWSVIPSIEKRDKRSESRLTKVKQEGK
jgi:hypothetical protein